MDVIFEILKVLLISYVLSDLSNFIGSLMSQYLKTNKMLLRLPILLLSYIMVCPKCFSMWFALILTGDLFIAALVSIIISVIKYFEDKYIKTIL